jgi:DNA-binding PadR family transcriptional regulator
MAGKGKRASLVEGRSPLKAAALAVLLEGPTYGYDVARQINRRMGASWHVQAKHIYAVLDQLKDAGLLRSEIHEVGDPPRSQRFYYPTDVAEQARRDWLITPPSASILRADIHARLAFCTEEEVPMLLRALNEWRVDLLEEIEKNAETGTPRVSWLGMIMSLYRSAVDKRLKAEVEWAGEACQMIEEFEGERRRR